MPNASACRPATSSTTCGTCRRPASSGGSGRTGRDTGRCSDEIGQTVGGGGIAADGDLEVEAQRRVITLFRDRLGCEYLGDWRDREDNRNIKKRLLERLLARQGRGLVLIAKVIGESKKAAALGGGRNLYEANREACQILRDETRIEENDGRRRSRVPVRKAGVRHAAPARFAWRDARRLRIHGLLRSRDRTARTPARSPQVDARTTVSYRSRRQFGMTSHAKQSKERH